MSEAIYTPGQIVVITVGEYSGYGISAIVRVLKPFSEKELTFGGPDRYSSNCTTKFLKQLIDGGLAEELSSHEIHSGCH